MRGNKGSHVVSAGRFQYVGGWVRGSRNTVLRMAFARVEQSRIKMVGRSKRYKGIAEIRLFGFRYVSGRNKQLSVESLVLGPHGYKSSMSTICRPQRQGRPLSG